MDSPRTALGVLAKVFVAVERVVSNQERKDADLIIIPRVGHIRWDQTRRADELLKAGYDAGLESIARIKEAHRPVHSHAPLNTTMPFGIDRSSFKARSSRIPSAFALSIRLIG